MQPLVFAAGLALAPTFTAHVRTWPDAAFVQTVVIETAGHLVVIDPGAAPNHAAAIRELVDSVGKPLAAVLLTHAHIDHYGALEWLDRADAPLITSAGVSRQLTDYHRINYARFARTAPPTPVPASTLGNGESLTVDGVTITLFDRGPGESYADAWFLVTGSDRTVAVVGDLAMFGLPPFLQSGHSGEWLRSLAELRTTVPSTATVYIGHDLAAPQRGAARGPEIFAWQAARLEAFRNAVASITKRHRLLTAAEIDRVVAVLHTDEPANLPAFDFLITTAANVLAAELIGEAAKERFEVSLRSMMTQPADRSPR